MKCCDPYILYICFRSIKVKVVNDQETAHSERRNSHSENGDGEITKLTITYHTKKTYRKPSEQLFPIRRPELI